MAYPEKLLASDEEVVLRLHPHWRNLVVPVLVVFAAAGLGAYGIAVVDQSVLRWIIVGLALFVVLVFTIWPALTWRTTHFIVTTHRVLIRTGVLSRSGRDVPLARINDVSFEHTVFERMFGSGTLTVESAGERGQVVMKDVPHVESVQSTLYALVEEDADRRTR
jgi:uncharacterized membrane protein YdbT with pleckstrin-like domain